MNALWNSTLGFSIIDLENDYFLVLLKTEGDAEFVLSQGLWTIMSHCLVVQPWTPYFDSPKEEINSVIAWIRLPGMVLHCYYKRILQMLDQIIGTIVRIDYNTKSTTRRKFAHSALKVALTNLLYPNSLWMVKFKR